MKKSIKTLEKNRKSILTDNLDYCIECGKPKVNIHEVYEGSYRRRSMENDMCIPLCFEHHKQIHNDYQFALKYKKMCQSKFEETHSREEFLKLFIKNYLDK